MKVKKPISYLTFNIINYSYNALIIKLFEYYKMKDIQYN